MRDGEESTRWQQLGTRGSFTMDTPIGTAILSKIADSEQWSARIETESGTRQSEPFGRREEAEAWVEQQVLEGQRMVDNEPT
jgi:hypothetical protein